MHSKSTKVQTFLEDLQLTSPHFFEITKAVRHLFFEQNILEEEMKYGGILFSRNGTALGGIFVYSKHLSIEFSNGAEFSDPEKKLEGKGKHRRHLKLSNLTDVDEKKVSFFINQLSE